MKKWNDELLEEEMKSMMEELPETQNLDRQIEEGIQRKIRKTVVKTVTVLALGILALILIVNPLMNAMFLNPAKLNQQPSEKSKMYLEKIQEESINKSSNEEAEVGSVNKFSSEKTDKTAENGASILLSVFRDYWETMQPYVEVVSIDVEKKGFSRYELSMQVANHREGLHMGVDNVWCDMAFGSYKNWKDPNMYLAKLIGRFSVTWNEKEDYVAQIKELPQSAVIYLSIGESEARAVEELRTILEEGDIELEWLQVYQPEVEFQGGLSLQMHAAYEETDKRESLTVEELKTVYLSNLENLLEHMDVWQEFGLYSGNSIYMQEEKVLNDTYENAKTLNALECKNYCISGERDAILAFLECIEVASIQVDEVKLSSLSQ